MFAGPAPAVMVIRLTFCRIREYGICSYNEPIPFECNGSSTHGRVTGVSGVVGMLRSIGVVEFDELIEALFRVGVSSTLIEDLVGSGRHGRIFGLWP